MPASAQAGALDLSFNGTGKVLTDFFNNSNDNASAVAIDGSGRIVVVGSSDANGTIDFAVARYNPDGSLDTSFGSNGKVTTDFAGGSDYGRAVAIRQQRKDCGGRQFGFGAWH